MWHTLLAASLWIPLAVGLHDVTHASVILGMNVSNHAVELLLTQASSRGADWTVADYDASTTWVDGPSIQLGMNRALAAGAFKLYTGSDAGHFGVKIEAADDVGLLDGVGRFLRELRFQNRFVYLPELALEHKGFAQNRWRLRGHQLTVAHHPSMFRSFPELVQFLQELVVFGTNQIEVAHINQFKGPDGEDHINISALAELSRAVDKVGLNMSIWLSADTPDINDLVEALPRLDALFFPGGDGGVLDWSLINASADRLRRYHPDAQVWVSAQEVDAQTLQDIMNRINESDVRGFLTGVVYGPHVRVPFSEFVGLVPQGYKVRQYPDICHALWSQFPYPDWDRAWAFTHGRQHVNPMPKMMDNVVALRSNRSTPTFGVGAYSEGLHDDLNKMLWSALAQDEHLSLEDLVRQYARFFFGADVEDIWAKVLFSFEDNFRGPIGKNVAISKTLSMLQRIETQTDNSSFANDWRKQMYLHRGYYDAYEQHRATRSDENEATAYKALRSAKFVGSSQALRDALEALHQPVLDSKAKVWRRRIAALANALNSSVGAEVLQAQDQQLNMATIDAPLNDAPFLNRSLADIAALTDERRRLDAIDTLLNWTNPGPGGFYDSLDSGSQRLVRGEGALADPSFYHTPLTHGSTTYSDGRFRLSWLRYAMTFFDGEVALRYTGLQPNTPYIFKVVYRNDVSHGLGTMRLVANGRTLVHDYIAPATEQVLTFPIDIVETQTGSLTLSCNRPSGGGGNGRTCEIAEAWLVVDESRHTAPLTV